MAVGQHVFVAFHHPRAELNGSRVGADGLGTVGDQLVEEVRYLLIVGSDGRNAITQL